MSEIRIDIKTAVDKTIADFKKVAQGILGIGKSAETTNKQTESFAKTFKKSAVEMKAQWDNLKQGAQIFIGVFKQAFQIGREAAELDYTISKFNKLSEAIGTTSELLMNDLRNATKGMVSDAELFKSAGDVMSLGLMKTHDQVVRLTKVAGGLGMDMNQLVLTLANQTTMRFDQLGVSVDGFDEKVASLQKTGMDASEAFKEAFLQQAEEQLQKVGEKADSAAASFQRMDVAITNAGDALKVKLAPGLVSAADAITILLTGHDKIIDAMGKHSQEVVITSKTYEDYVDEMIRAAEVAGLINNVDAGLIKTQLRLGEVNENYRKKLSLVTQEEYNKAKAAEAARNAIDGLKVGQNQLTDSTDNVTQAEIEHLQASKLRAVQLNDIKNIEAELVTKEAELKTASDNLAASQQGWMDRAGGDIVSMLDQGWISATKYDAALNALDATYGTDFLSQHNYKEDAKKLVDEFKRTGDVEAFKTKLGELKNAYMPLDEQVIKNMESVNLLKDAIDSLESKEIYIYQHMITVYDDKPRLGSGPRERSGQGSGNIGVDQEFAEGGSMVVPPGHPNDDYIIGVSSGEQVNVTPPGQAGAGGINIYGDITVVANNPTDFINQLRNARKSGAAYIHR